MNRALIDECCAVGRIGVAIIQEIEKQGGNERLKRLADELEEALYRMDERVAIMIESEEDEYAVDS